MPILALQEDEEAPSESEDSEQRLQEQNQKKQDAYRQKTINMELAKLTGIKGVPVPARPAPPQSPGRTKKVIPNDFITAKPKSALERTLNSTLGRAMTIFVFILNYALLIFVTISWNSPQRWLDGQALPMVCFAVLVATNLYTAVPVLSSYSGLMVSETGVDWKVYFVSYRLAYFTSVPGVIFMYFGPGDRAAFGQPEQPDISLTALAPASYKFFRATDGFVALNLTKGITETLQKTVHNRNVPRLSRYRDAEIVNNEEPFSNEVEPTVPPGFMETYRISPVFLEWAPCTTRYRISAGCLNQNQVIGWAVATARSLCTNLRMVSCREQDPLLDPVYHCATNPATWAKRTSSIQGICGRSVPPPAAEVIDELSALLLLDGWPENRLPNETHGWYDVWPEVRRIRACISDIERCDAQWMLGGLTAFLALLPLVIDCRTDAKIRGTLAFQAVRSLVAGMEESMVWTEEEAKACFAMHHVLMLRDASKGGTRYGGDPYEVWKYFVTFTNRGEETVQMLTRHWIFVDAKGNLNAEVKGPGARGVTPVLPPGGEWSYESGTSLDTVFGSMHGSFQFDILKGSTSGSGSRSFSARVGRLALSNDGKPKDVPCIEEASEGLLPLTSVLSLERVILGARGEFHMAKDGLYYFQYDVQINNARDTEIEVLGHSWEVVDQEQRHEIVVAGDGVGGIYKHRRRALAAGDAFRVSGQLPAKTRFANAQGTYRVLIRENGAEREIEARTDFMGLSVDKAITHVPNFMSDPSFQ
ncbi:Protein ApaG [Durusdinium trenchii]|uniref:Protein ApaG n=1 Tax=Durusdinium trenchii TaxID=1381693 RepID=A0ABP0LNI4_9DINO